MDKTIEGVTMDIAKLTNVKYSEKFNEHRIANVPIAAPNMLNTVVWELATRNPQWTFYVAAGNSHGERFRADEFDVRIDNESVGKLHHAFYRREYCVGISNKRIGGKLDRGDMMRTKDISKAVQIAKKHFGKQSAVELTDEAFNLIKGAINHVVFTHDRKVRDAREPFDRIAREYFLSDGLDVFKAHLETKTNGSFLLNKLDTLFEMIQEKSVVDMVHSRYNDNETCTVVLNSGTYIVKNPDETVASFTDDTLPDYMRSKIGLLKLVKTGAVVGDIGFRASDTTFVIIIGR